MDPLTKAQVAITVNADHNDHDQSNQVEPKGVSSSNTNEKESTGSCVSGGGVVDLENGGDVAHCERDCRICHLSLDSGNQEFGLPVELGCSCKDDLAFAHKLCAEAWFKIKGNKTCEICGSFARNIAGENEVELVEVNDAAAETTDAAPPVQNASENESFFQGNWLLNFVLACMALAVAFSWLFHFNIPS